MESWNEIIQVALMGTEKKSVNLLQLPQALQEHASRIVQNQPLDREDQFLQTATLAAQAKRAGYSPYSNESVVPLMAPQEELPYAPAASHSLLKQIMELDEIFLLRWWLQHCLQARCIVNPEWLPRLFEKGQQQRKLQALLAACGGKRGEWICRYNEAWNYSSSLDPAEIWMHGNWEQRKEVLQELRKTDRPKAMALLTQTWTTEDATTRLNLLELIELTANKDDLEFLESLEQDKSKKVRDKALEIQQKIPASKIVAFYVQFMRQAFTIHKEKSLLGMLSKSEIRFQLPAAMEAELYKTGLQKLSADKSMSDAEYICYQVIERMPPNNWEEITGLYAEAFIHLLQKDEFGKKMIPALVLSIKRFRAIEWAQYMLKYCSVFYIDLIPYLEEAQRDAYSLKYFEKYPDNVVGYSLSFNKEWTLEFCQKLLKYTAGKPYQFPKSFYSEHLALIPVGIAGHLANFTPRDSYLGSLWKGISEHLYLLLKLKHQTKQSFNA